MRVLFLTRAYSNTAGGMERLSFELIEQSKKDSTLQVDVLAHTGSRFTAPFFVFTCIPALLQKAKQADVMHIGDPLLSLPGFLVKKFLNKPVAVTIHGLDILYSNPLYRLYLHLFFRAFDLYLPISQHAKKLLDSWVVTGKTSVIVPGFIDQYFKPETSRKDLGELVQQDLSGKIVLFTSGRLVQRKGHAWFITAVLPSLPKNVLYVIAGEGSEKETIEKAIHAKGLEQQVVLLGKVAHEKLLTLYNTVDAFVQPNISVPNDAEGFGLVLIEAASCERVVFAADIDGIPDAIQHDKNGVLLASEDPEVWIETLKGFAANKETYTQKGKEARSYTLQTFNWGKQAATFIAALKTIQQ